MNNLNYDDDDIDEEVDEVTLEERKVIDALEKGDYKVSFEEPNNLSRCFTPSGREFFVARGDDARFGVDGGSCIVEVGGKTYTCDLSNGEWDSEMSEELKDALEDADGVLSGEMLEPEQQALVYAKANNRDPDEIEVYWYEDDECPVDADDVLSPRELGEGVVELEGRKYYTLEDPELEDEELDNPIFAARAIADGSVADDNGYYDCVKIVYEAVPDGNDGYDCGKAVRVADCDSYYNAIEGGF